ncbi:MAG: elongation factor 4 [Chloroflexi bacterium AL-W]|nr:elongation factor 4 [Chloroflexi bacterium AL-N1]NOK68207.1 elongation factor 4 [Chloroflexi bacterium AL-N10]NOK73853.1 elongation factor 4 [Chloroflexi bacterium AL-N5]NOK82821.1 elongation factor 4 [Chloroflexi bacterium AL-W]NOK90343.1 elongation factor 4 [Chloroflexi bacterium AL-N15]
MWDQRLIRNFSIIAHIDHGKTTLSDRFLEVTGTISERERREQLLDAMDLEREKGITIKAKAVRMDFQSANGQIYQFNLIDCPGHVDFTYEVSRALAACEGAILVVDAAQGIEAQTLANVYLALENDLTIIPVINKIDLPGAQPEFVAEEIENVIGIAREEIMFASAKEGRGVTEILEAVVERIPPPGESSDKPARALIFDSHYDPYKGVVAYVRTVEGIINNGDRILMLGTQIKAEMLELGAFRPVMTPLSMLSTGEVGYIATGLKSVDECQVGDTITVATRPAQAPLPGYRAAKPMVFAGLYPVESNAYTELREALEKLKLNDAALSFLPETSAALGFGFRCGFLGLLHMEIVRERLEREYDLDLLITAPSVEYQVLKTDGELIAVDNPSEMPEPGLIDSIEEPVMQISIIVPTRYIGTIMELVTGKRGSFETMEYLDPQRVLMKYRIPLAEIVVDFYDQLKSRTQGYASLDYNLDGYQESDLVKLDVLVNATPVDALSLIVHRDFAYHQGRALTEQLRKLIPRQMFEVPIQAAIGSKVIARETIRALRKDVLSKCYGGDVTRKKKLLAKQAEGKKRMKMVGSVEIPQEAFMAVLSLNDSKGSTR